MSNDVTLLTDADLGWPFRSEPQYSLKTSDDAWATTTIVDPFPCYAHDVGLVAQCLGRAKAAFPMDPSPHVFVLSHETQERTNGWAQPVRSYRDVDGEEKYLPDVGQIVLAGKRIPLHPAMTRYLVAHEYGHHVQYAIERRRGLSDQSTELAEEYAALRGLETGLRYGGRTWHRIPGEVLANDFRVLLADAEPEFWPHPGVPLPGDVPAVVEWWEREREQACAALAAAS